MPLNFQQIQDEINQVKKNDEEDNEAKNLSSDEIRAYRKQFFHSVCGENAFKALALLVNYQIFLKKQNRKLIQLPCSSHRFFCNQEQIEGVEGIFRE